METTVVLLYKDSIPFQWSVLVNHQKFTLTTPKSALLEQLVYVVNDIIELFDLYDKAVTFCSPSFIRSVLYDVVLIFPQVNFVPLADAGVARVFNDVMTSANAPIPRKKIPSRGTLYVCSDASKSSITDLCGWAWYSTAGGTEGYDFGVSVHKSIVHAELEGILRSIVSNRNNNFSTLHVTCDSLQSVHWANDLIFSRVLKDHSTRSLNSTMLNLVHQCREMVELNKKTLRIQWVKGHAKHRLNAAADYLSREARLAANRREKLDKTSPQIEGVLSFMG